MLNEVKRILKEDQDLVEYDAATGVLAMGRHCRHAPRLESQ
jgi:hypothetical protein